jgi:uncharacterized membrane protein
MAADRTDRSVRVAALVLAVVGIAVAGYLTYIHYEGIKPVCGLGGDCEKVQTSEWSKLAGIPVALLGLVGYVLILGALVVDGERGRLAAVVVAISGFGFSLYLTYRELYSIDAICPWCVASAVILTLLAVLATIRFIRGADDGVARSEPVSDLEHLPQETHAH